MLRKLITALGITMILALLLRSVGLAAQSMAQVSQAKPGNRFGQVNSITKNQFTLQNGKGKKQSL